MEPLTEPEIRASFVNCSKGEVKRLRLPVDLDELRWHDLDFLGWVDPRAPLQAYVVAPLSDGTRVGFQLRRNVGGAGPKRARMCSWCLTRHTGPGVSLMVAPRAGAAGREGNSLGVDVCADLRCSLYLRGLVPRPSAAHARETLSLEDQVARLATNVEAFAVRVRNRA